MGCARSGRERIGVLGICGSGGFAPYAAQTHHRMRAVATVSAVDIASFFRDPTPRAGKRWPSRRELRSVEAAGKPATMVSALLELDQVDDSIPSSVQGFVDYYMTPRGQHPRCMNRCVAHSAGQLDQHDSYAEVDKIAPRPLLMVAGSEAETLPYSQRRSRRPATPPNCSRSRAPPTATSTIATSTPRRRWPS